MSTENNEISLNFLDHVAIRVKDLNTSADWYERVLGLKKYQLPEYGEFPIFCPKGDESGGFHGGPSFLQT